MGTTTPTMVVATTAITTKRTRYHHGDTELLVMARKFSIVISVKHMTGDVNRRCLCANDQTLTDNLATQQDSTSLARYFDIFSGLVKLSSTNRHEQTQCSLLKLLHSYCALRVNVTVVNGYFQDLLFIGDSRPSQ